MPPGCLALMNPPVRLKVPGVEHSFPRDACRALYKSALVHVGSVGGSRRRWSCNTRDNIHAINYTSSCMGDPSSTERSTV